MGVIFQILGGLATLVGTLYMLHEMRQKYPKEYKKWSGAIAGCLVLFYGFGLYWLIKETDRLFWLLLLFVAWAAFMGWFDQWAKEDKKRRERKYRTHFKALGAGWPLKNGIPMTPPWCAHCWAQMSNSLRLRRINPIEEWRCPRCGRKVEWDKSSYVDALAQVRELYIQDINNPEDPS